MKMNNKWNKRKVFRINNFKSLNEQWDISEFHYNNDFMSMRLRNLTISSLQRRKKRSKFYKIERIQKNDCTFQNLIRSLKVGNIEKLKKRIGNTTSSSRESNKKQKHNQQHRPNPHFFSSFFYFLHFFFAIFFFDFSSISFLHKFLIKHQW